MAILGIDISNEAVKQFTMKTIDRLKREDIILNPFNGTGYFVKKPISETCFLVIKPVYLNLSYYLFGLAAIMVFFWGFGWFNILLMLFALGNLIVHSTMFFKFMFRKGLRRTGFKERFEFID
jgi:hypothetical protein